jgi:SAM-dependent methyltransferase
VEPVRVRAQRLAREYLDKGDFAAWFDAMYAASGGDPGTIPWADMAVNDSLAEWLARGGLLGHGRKALVVGCGLGDDAQELARIGFDVTAFDIAPKAIEWCRKRFPSSPVGYTVADLFKSPQSWNAGFDFVFEAYTLQSLPPELRIRAMERIAAYVAPGGTLLVVARGREPHEEPPGPPWPLVRSELATFGAAGLTEVLFEDYMDREDPPVRRFRVEYRR